MNRKMAWVLIWTITIAATVLYSGEIRPANAGPPPANQGHKNIEGTVTQVTADTVTLDTGKGVIKTFTFNPMDKKGLRNFKVGDLILLDLDDGGQVVDLSILKAK